MRTTSTMGVNMDGGAAEPDLFRSYLDGVGRHQLLSKQDGIALYQAYEQGLDAQPELAEGAAVVLAGLGVLTHRTRGYDG